MKFRYYLRGIGIGIVFTAIIVLAVYSNNIPSKMTDEEVIRRAKQLGMVEADDPITKFIDKDDSEASGTEDSTTDNQSSENISTEAESTEEISTENTSADNTTQEKSSEQNTEKNTEQTTEKKEDKSDKENDKNSDKQSTSKETYEITIDRGSSSFPVCQKLEELGLIDDAAKFDDFLIANGYADRISVGTHRITKGMDYKEIAELISDPL